MDESALRDVAGKGILSGIVKGVDEESEWVESVGQIADLALPLLNFFESEVNVSGVEGDLTVKVDADGSMLVSLPT